MLFSFRRRTKHSRTKARNIALHRPRFRPWLECLEDRNLLSSSIPLSSTDWTPLGPASLNAGQADAGRITALAADPTNADLIYAATAGGGLWKTSDGGSHWNALTDGQANLSLGALAVAASNPQVIYAGTGEANYGPSQLALGRSTVSYGDGILLSTDGGNTWTLEGQSIFDRLSISRIVVDPTDANTVYVAVGAAAVNGLPGNTGIWKSTDGGNTWTDTTAALTTTAPFSDLVMSPTDNQVLYAAVGDPNGNTANGIYQSSDGGNTWSLLSNFPNGATNSGVGRISLAIAPTSPQTLYASIAAAGGGGSFQSLGGTLLSSSDGGATWTASSSVPNYMGQTGDYDTALAVDPNNPLIIYAGGGYGTNSIVESTDGGNTWTDISSGANGTAGPHGGHHAFAFDAAGHLLDGTDGGLFQLTNPTPGSIAWADLNGNLNNVQLTSVALDPTTINNAYVGTQDDGTAAFSDNLIWNQIDAAGGITVVGPGSPLTLYHDSPVSVVGPANFVSVSTDGGNTWTPITNGIDAANEPTDYYPPLVADPSVAGRLLLGTSRVYETLNGGSQWTAISTPGANGWTASTAIDALATAPSDANTVYAATQGHLFVTFDDGGSWQQVDIPGFNDHIAALVVSPTNNQVAYAVRDRFTGGPGGHVFETTDGGADWTDISGNLPDVPVNALTLDPQTGLILVGTDAGVYATNDGGNSWSALGAGLPNARVTGLDWNPTQNILAAATAGRGLWEIDLMHFAVTPTVSSTPAGVPIGLTVTALDPFGTVDAAYTGTVHFTSTAAASLPADYTFMPGDAGTHAFTGIALMTQGSQTVTASDTVNPSVAGSTSITVTAPVLSINNVSLPEGNLGTTPFTFTVTLSAASSQTTTVNYTTADGTATTSQSDYQATSGTLTFNPGETSKTITVLVNGNTLNEADETFFVNLSGANNAGLATAQGTGTILNDDAYPTLSISSVTHTIGTSGITTYTFRVTLSVVSGQTVTVNYATADGTATAGSDYKAASGTLIFSPGQTSQTINVSVYGTSAIEPLKTFYVNLSGNSHAILLNGQGIGTIQNNNLKVSINDITADEPTSGYSWVNFTVSLSAAASFPVEVNFATSSGTAKSRIDYIEMLDGLVTIPAGQTSQTLSIALLATPPSSGSKFFYVTLNTPTNAIRGSHYRGTCTILETVPPPAVSIADVSQAEGNSGQTPFAFTVSLSTPSAQTVTVNYATADGTAIAGTDYQAANGTISFAPGQISKTVSVPVIGNTIPQPDRTFSVNLTQPVNATLGTSQATGTILDDDPSPLVSVTNTTAFEGNSGHKSFNFTVGLSAPSTQTVTLQYATADGTATGTANGGSDYVSQTGTITFTPGQTKKVITVLVNGNTTVEPDKTFFVNITGGTNVRILPQQGWGTGVGTILNDDLSVSLGNVTVTQPITGVTSAFFPVTLSAAAPFPVTVSYVTQNGSGTAPGQDYMALSGTLTFQPGQTSLSVAVPVFGEYYSEDDETFRLKLTSVSNAMISNALGTATLINTTPLTLAVSNVTQLEGNSGMTGFVFTLSLSGAPHEGSVAIQYTTADGTAIAGTDYQATSGTVNLGPYQYKTTITVWVYGNTIAQPDRTFYLDLSSPFGAAQGLGTIVDDDGTF